MRGDPLANVYLDTSFFTGYLERNPGRKKEAEKILNYEREQKSILHTSTLTLNEFCCKAYDEYRGEDNCEAKVQEMVLRIRAIATPAAFSDAIMTFSAFLMSLWGERHKHAKGTLPDMKKCRWDAIHIATAHVLGCVRAYSWDKGWPNYQPDVPSTQIISPAVCPQASIGD